MSLLFFLAKAAYGAHITLSKKAKKEGVCFIKKSLVIDNKNYKNIHFC